MEVTNENSAMLSNYEVLALLQEGKKGKHIPTNVATISYETTRYLESTPCKQQKPETIKNLMEALAPFNLTKAEKLQLLNLRPTSVVELQLIVEELDERLKSEEEIETILKIIKDTLSLEDTGAVKSTEG
eukprot:gene387-10053_t